MYTLGTCIQSVPFFFEYQIQQNMKELTLKDKQRIVAMLYEHYTIDPAAAVIIDVAADSTEQVIDLTLKAFSMVSKPKSKDGATPNVPMGIVTKCISVKPDAPSNEPAVDNNGSTTVKIDQIASKLSLVKAVNDVTNWGLKRSKAFVDGVVHTSFIPGSSVYTYEFRPLKLGLNRPITVEQWKRIVERNEDVNFKWHFEGE